MNTVEKLIAAYVVDRLVNADYEVSVHDGEQEGERTTSVDKIVKAMGEVEDERLLVYVIGQPEAFAWVRFVYGNGNNGFDVVSDYTTNIEAVMSRVSGYVDGMEAMLKVIAEVFK